MRNANWNRLKDSNFWYLWNQHFRSCTRPVDLNQFQYIHKVCIHITGYPSELTYMDKYLSTSLYRLSFFKLGRRLLAYMAIYMKTAKERDWLGYWGIYGYVEDDCQGKRLAWVLRNIWLRRERLPKKETGLGTEDHNEVNKDFVVDDFRKRTPVSRSERYEITSIKINNWTSRES